MNIVQEKFTIVNFLTCGRYVEEQISPFKKQKGGKKNETFYELAEQFICSNNE
ncbi:hypothetical protein OSO01_37520 [Oceanobacillus sojae]|uniref:Uncharacterized protein n=1 Tax=Oceanobacillus sojae TaxID=582851 RepID=A0A511ZNI2_9BACI|nr:hypothetical protein OSO01_37520 [Oceanobacillus sojae]